MIPSSLSGGGKHYCLLRMTSKEPKERVSPFRNVLKQSSGLRT
jgi:hypothetical protein